MTLSTEKGKWEGGRETSHLEIVCASREGCRLGLTWELGDLAKSVGRRPRPILAICSDRPMRLRIESFSFMSEASIVSVSALSIITVVGMRNISP